MSDGLQTIQIMLADAAAWRGRMEDRMDEAITTMHTVAGSVERFGLEMKEIGKRVSDMEATEESIAERVAALEGANGGRKKVAAVAAGVGGSAGVLGTLLSSGLIDVAVAIGKRIFP